MNKTIRFAKIRQQNLLIRLICQRILVFGLWSLVFAACTPTATPAGLPAGQISAIEAVGGARAAGFARVTTPREFVFPQDHGPHQEICDRVVVLHRQPR